MYGKGSKKVKQNYTDNSVKNQSKIYTPLEQTSKNKETFIRGFPVEEDNDLTNREMAQDLERAQMEYEQ